MEKTEAVREWCLERALQVLILQRDNSVPQKSPKTLEQEAIQVAKEFEKYICS